MVDPQAAAAARDASFAHFIHTKLTAKDGLPAQANSIVQTPDGYMWFGTPDGLYRFTGQSFERIPTDGKNGFTDAAIIEAIVTRSGQIWLALGQNSGVGIVRDGVIYRNSMPVPPPQVTHLVEGADGAIWAASSGRDKRLFRYAAGRWQQMDVRLSMPAGAVADMEVDRHGTLWFSLADRATGIGRLAYLNPNSDRIALAQDKIGLGRLALDRNGGLWVSDNFGTRQLREASGRPPPRVIAYPPAKSIGFPRIRFDKKGNLWGSSLSGGMFLIPDAGNADKAGRRPQTFGEDDRIGTVATLDVFPDREGNVWISSSESLHRFHPANAVPVAGIASDPRSPQRLAAATDGSVYLFSLGKLFHIQPNGEPQLIASNLANTAVLCAARSGGVWLLENDRTTLFNETRRRAFPQRTGSVVPTLCEEDGYGRLWSVTADEVSWLRAGSWHKGFPGLGPVDVWDVATDSTGALLLSVDSNKLIRIDETKATLVQTGWDASVASMRNTRIGLLVSHSNGLWRAPGEDRPAASILSRSLAKRRDFDVGENYVWAFGVNGVERIAVADLDKAWGKTSVAPGMMFDWSEGLPIGKQDVAYRGRQIVAGRDGRVWVLTRAGPYVIDAREVVRNAIAPPIVVRELWADGHLRSSPGATHLRLPGGTRSVRIAYSALSYSMPDRVQFKYRLMGTSDEWTPAGNRHEVAFGNLGPGDYRFEVAGANEDGVWNNTVGALDFTIAPTFIQSVWFKIGAALLLLAAIIVAYQWRTYILTTRVRKAMSERLAERDRIARELHDTLLQSVQGLILRFQLLVNHLPNPHPSRDELSTTLDQADEVLAESRQRVLELRARHPRSDLKSVIAALAQRQLPAARFQTSIRATGEVVPVESSVFNALIDVANECLFNIVRHSEASAVQVDLHYGASHLEMNITDNGVGLNADSISHAAVTGHFGVLGMKERIAGLGGKFNLESTAGNGTTITVRIPSAIAYRTETTQTGQKGRGWPWFARQAPEPMGR